MATKKIKSKDDSTLPIAEAHILLGENAGTPSLKPIPASPPKSPLKEVTLFGEKFAPPDTSLDALDLEVKALSTKKRKADKTVAPDPAKDTKTDKKAKKEAAFHPSVAAEYKPRTLAEIKAIKSVTKYQPKVVPGDIVVGDSEYDPPVKGQLEVMMKRELEQAKKAADKWMAEFSDKVPQKKGI
jgi:hypothetical protein